jgi:hypothetical protein
MSRHYKKNKTALVASEAIASRIVVLRGQRVMLDADLAALYGVTTKRLNEQVRRNLERFPSDFMFQLINQEVAILKSQFATSSWGGKRKLSREEWGSLRSQFATLEAWTRPAPQIPSLCVILAKRRICFVFIRTA